MPKIKDLRSEENKNPLYCHWCDEYKFVECEEHIRNKNDENIVIRNFYYICNNCETRELSILKDKAYHYKCLYDPILIKQDNGNFTLWKPARTLQYESLDLKYDWLDYYWIPGLTRIQDDWSLTPVFFKKDLLSYFNHRPDYKVKMYWWSVASICKKTDTWREELADWGIGINRYWNLFVFLWDLDDYLRHWSISDEEMKLWKATNIESDHDVVSDLYAQQIEVCYTIPDNERRIFQQIEEINEHTEKLFSFKLFDFDYDKVDNEYKYPIFNEKDQIARSVNLLCQYIIEWVNRDWIKSFLMEKSIKFDTKDWSNRLLGKFISHYTQENLVNWLFVLYDLEILLGHQKSPKWHDEKLKTCFERLNIQETVDYLELFKSIVTEIINNFDELIESLKWLDYETSKTEEL